MTSESICNWPYCTKKGEFKKRLSDGKVWAIFCKNHEAQYITGPRPSGVMDMLLKAIDPVVD